VAVGVAVVFQDPYSALNPLRTVGSVVTEALRPTAKGNEARERVVELLDAVGLPDPETLINRYPHELSGGMCQRVLIATALASNPTMLIADEPTSSLDVTLQAEVLAFARRPSSKPGAGDDPDQPRSSSGGRFR
jgi:ABC-type dipeptide/oligopeptide/nickel transport system ATPase component